MRHVPQRQRKLAISASICMLLQMPSAAVALMPSTSHKTAQISAIKLNYQESATTTMTRPEIAAALHLDDSAFDRWEANFHSESPSTASHSGSAITDEASCLSTTTTAMPTLATSASSTAITSTATTSTTTASTTRTPTSAEVGVTKLVANAESTATAATTGVARYHPHTTSIASSIPNHSISNDMANDIATKVRAPSFTKKVPATKRRRRRKWDTMIVRLEEYHAHHGHSMVPKEDDHELHMWLQTIRKNYSHQIRHPDRVLPNRPRLDSHDMRRLAKVDFCWNVKATVWDRRYAQLKAFRDQHGHCRVTMYDDVQLSVFVQNQRQEFRKLQQFGRQCYQTTLTADRIEKLNRLGFQWSRGQKATWEHRYKELLNFKDRFGHADVPQRYDGDPKLGVWCMNQRTKYKLRKKGKSGGLTDEQVQKLESIGFSWNTRAARWQNMLRKLQAFYEEHGHTEVPKRDVNNADLRLWLIWQRFLYNSSQRDEPTFYVLPQSRIDQLEAAIPDFKWKVRDSNAPSKEDWSKLLVAIQEKGIKPGMRAKQHWFEGLRPNQVEVKSEYTDEELVDLWNSGDDDEDGDPDGGDGDDFNGDMHGDGDGAAIGVGHEGVGSHQVDSEQQLFTT